MVMQKAKYLHIRPTRIEDVWAVTALAMPLILTNFAHVALSTIDIVILGSLGTLEIAAGGLAIALFNQLRTTGTGLVTSVSNLVAEAHARGEHQRVSELLVAGIFWASMLGVLFVMLLLVAHAPLVLLGQDPNVVSRAIDFLMIAAPGLLPALWFQTLRHFTVGLKRPGPLLAITLISIALSGGLNYVLVFGKLGIPPMGLQGVALATSIVFLLSFLMFLGVVLANRNLAPYLARNSLRLTRESLKAVWNLGIPIAGTYASEAGFFSVLTLLIGTLGAESLAAQTVLNQIIYIVFMISAGISHSASIHISDACGRQNYVLARRFGNIGLALGTASMLLIAIPYALIPETIVSWFISSNEHADVNTLRLATHGLLIAAVLQIFDATQNIGNGILRGTGDSTSPFKISLIGYWLIGLPASYLLGKFGSYGIYGVWIGQTVGLAMTAALLIISFHGRVNRLSLNETVTLKQE